MEAALREERQHAHLKAVADEVVGVFGKIDIGWKGRAHALGTKLRGAQSAIDDVDRTCRRPRTLNMAPMKPSPSQGREPASISMQMQPRLQMSALAE